MSIRFYGDIVNHTSRALAFADGEITIEDVIHGIDSGWMRAWLVFRGGNHIATAVTEIIEMPAKRIVRVLTLGGKDMKAFINELINALMNYARNVGATDIDACARPGMARTLQKAGWNRVYEVMRVKV